MKYVTLALIWSLALAGLLGASTYDPLPTLRATEAEIFVADIFDQHLVPASESPVRNLELARHLLKLCDQHGLDPALVLSLIEVESHFRAEVVSPMGAIGLMQLMPATANEVARNLGWDESPGMRMEDRLRDPFVNLSLGIAYLANLRARYLDFPTSHALAAYNLGPSRLDRLVAEERQHPRSVQLYSNTVVKGISKFRVKGLDSHV